MIKRLLLFAILYFYFYDVSSQISEPGIPESFSIKTKRSAIIPNKLLKAIDTSYFLREDKNTGIPNRYGVVQQLDVDIKTEGVRTEIAGKGYIWQFEVNSVQAYSLGITFGKFFLPEGAKVFIYDNSHSQLAGAFTSLNNNPVNQLTIADFIGQNAIIEYFEPFKTTFPGQLSIVSVSQAYRDPLKAVSTRIGINCTQGANWQDLKHAVCRMTFQDTKYEYYCTGFLVNNVREDGTPYFQTANHCISTSTEAASLVTYFNYENSTCSSSDAPITQTLSGATLKATSSYSDFTLLQLYEYPKASYLPYFAGWDASSRSPHKGTCIHHPAGTAKCIAIENSAPTTYSRSLQWTDDNNVVVSTSAANTHWDAIFDAGATEGGSSGSPLLDDNQRVIGQLHGGTTTDNYYGKFSVSWNHNSASTAQLKYWLDPDNTGTLYMDGYYSTLKPTVSFATDFTRICSGTPIKFSDLSKYNISAWNWNIQPSSYKFANGTNRNSKNPEIIFDSIANYTVSLRVANANGADSITKTNYISAGDIRVKFSGISADSVVCGCNLINYPLAFSGASNYALNLERQDKITSTIKSDSVFLSLIPTEKKNGSFKSWVKVIGTQGTCTSADSIEMKISMPANDDIENAIRLSPGSNRTYSNFCASVETKEAAPSTTALNNTIWFTFLGPSNGKISIDTHGFNDHMAVYAASSFADLLSGIISSYTLIASNDGLIENLSVEPYKSYWLQVDGLRGSTGSFSIDLLSNSLEVFPNPTAGEVNVIISNMDDGIAHVNLFSPLGQVVYSNELSVSKDSNRFAFNLSTYPNGVYLIVVRINGTTMKAKIMVAK
jgi:PKD repeat protein